MKNSKHIAIFVPSFLGGGVEKMMVYLANNFVGKNYTVDYIVINNSGPYKKLLSSQVNIVDLRKKRILNTIFPLTKYLNNNKPDALLTAMNYVNIIAIVSCILSYNKINIIISERAITSLNIIQSRYSFLMKILIKLFYKYPKKIVAISTDVKTDLENNFNVKSKKIKVIYNMVNINKINKVIPDESIRKQLGIKTTNNLLIAIGRLDKYKNFQYLISSLVHLKNLNNTHLILLGDGEEKESLVNQINLLNLNKNVSLLGFVDNPESYLKVSNLFISTSTQEGFGNVIIEAMAAGVPVVVTNCLGGPREILCNGKFGELVPLNKPQILAKAIEKSLSRKKHPDIKKRSKDFSINIISQQYLNFLFQ
ncbi:glycosyltransferase [Croceibacter atlanticus]|uniref:Glycosyl transferase group 1 n=1 Tax=Croceibacter atlanticus (strain ATCC BAA-628 / JCM 21780 / CIP 108009 / IAM 15332 / KCTC 12090 / HTCC2559) TaxID=216432 RepID=A3UAX8_CROAH|nr:glycosyltransferase [Croceibacter atlanticus]EAP86964.1 Glycosyl transferase group 1 [Croceibacter atlanticus HTCC2559]